MGRGVCGGGVMDSAGGVMSGPEGALESTEGVLESTEGVLESAEGALESAEGALGSAEGALGSAVGALRSAEGALESSEGALRSPSRPFFSPFGRLVFGFVSIFGGSGVERSRSCSRSRGDCAGNGGERAAMRRESSKFKWGKVQIGGGGGCSGRSPPPPRGLGTSPVGKRGRSLRIWCFAGLPFALCPLALCHCATARPRPRPLRLEYSPPPPVGTGGGSLGADGRWPMARGPWPNPAGRHLRRERAG